MENIDLCRLVEITYQILVANDITDCNDIKFDNDPKKILSKISMNYFKNEEVQNCVNICSWLNCDTNGYATLVRHKLSSSDKTNEHSTSIVFIPSEWQTAEDSISGKEKRSYFKREFDSILSKKLQEKGYNCWVLNSHNWFKKNKSRKKVSHYWSGLYYCINKNCGEFEAFISNEPVKNCDVVVNLKVKNVVDHEKINKKIQLRGLRRKKLLEKIVLYGTDQARSQIIIQNSESNQLLEFPTNRSVFNNIKYGHVHRDRISNDVFTDSLATKINGDKIVMNMDPNRTYKGFIQEISMVPFGYLLLSGIQLKIWEAICQTKPIWHFDATGSILVDIASQKKPFLYSIVAHDSKNHKILPIAEFITTSHITSNITKYLISIKNIFNANIPEKKFPRITVTDFSYALINSIMTTFNCCSLNTYVLLCFDLLVRKKNQDEFFSRVKMISYLCATHFLKLIINKTKSFQASGDSKKLLYFGFSLLQNSTTLEQFENYLANLFNIFNQKFKTSSVEFSVEMIRKELIRNNLNTETLDEIKTDNQKKRDMEFEKHLNNTVGEFDADYESELIGKSPFKIYFQSTIAELNQQLITGQQLNQTQDLNKYFAPGLFKVIENYLYLLPLWSGIVIQYVPYIQKNAITRITNNPVENWFGHLKNNILHNRKVMTSELVSSLYVKLESNFIEYYDSKSETSVNEKTKNSQTNSTIEEVWKDKNTKSKRQKSFYYKTFPGFLINSEEENSEARNLHPTLDFLEIFGDQTQNQNQYITKLRCLFEKITNEDSLNEIKKMVADNKAFFNDCRNLIYQKKSLTNFKKHPIDKNFQSLIDANKFSNYYPVKVENLANSLYEAFSILLFDNAYLFLLFKLGSLFTILEYENFFTKILETIESEYNFEELIIKTSKENQPANEMNIISLSIFSKRPIFVYNYDPKDKFSLNLKYHLIGDSNDPIPIGFNSNYFIPLLADSQNSKLHQIDLDVYSKYKDNIEI